MSAHGLFVGRADRRELRPALECLRDATRPLRVVDDMPAALRTLDSAPEIQRIILAPSFPGEFTERQERQLLAARPLADVWVLVGSWIEGETRSGRPWRCGQRMYLHQLPAWVNFLRATDAAAVGPPWRPATMSDDEAWQQSVHAPWPELSGCVAICSEVEASRCSLELACRAFGLRTVRSPLDAVGGGDGVDYVLYDAVSDRRRWPDHIRTVRQHYDPEALVALVNFPRPHEVDQLVESGATAVLGKPYRLQDLVSAFYVATVRGEVEP